MQRPRSYSFDDSLYPETYTEQEESELEKELASKIAARKTREQKNGTLYIKSTSWLRLCCGIFAGGWQKRYGQLTPDKILLKPDENGPELGSIPLKNSKISLTEEPGHNGKHNCLNISTFGSDYFLSFENNEELRAWVLALTYMIESIEKQSSFF